VLQLRCGLREAVLARLFVIVGGLLVAVLMAALLAPLFIDWTSYRANFEREASKILGRPVKVAGEASARILPFPSLSFTNVRVGEDIENPALTVERFSMDAELAPFLSGEVLIYDMRVVRPRGIIVLDKAGKIDWTLRPNSPFDPGNVSIENMVVEGGQFDLIDRAAGRTHSITLPNAVITAKALTGPWRMNGEAQFDGEPMHLSVSTGQVEKGVLPLRISALSSARSIVIESDGSAKSDDGKASYAGQFVLRPALKSDHDLAKVKIASSQSDKAAALFKVTGKFGLAPSGLALPEFKLQTGARENPYVANGTGSLIFGVSPMFDLKLDGTQVNFGKADDASTGAGTGLADRIETLKTFFSTVPMPTIPGSIEVNLPAIVAGDTTIRDIAFNATPENGAWRVRSFKSTLPGRTQLEADGVLGQGDAFGFTGKLLVASNQPAGLSNWLTGQVDPAIRRLNAIGFSADVALKPDAQTLDNLELALGTAIFKGRAERRNDGERPVLSLTLSGGALDLDSLNALGQGLVGTNGESRFAGHDVTLSLDAGPVSQNGIEAASLGVSLRIKSNVVEIDRLMLADIAGSSVSATGKISDLGDAYSGNIDASLVSANGRDFADMLAKRFPGNAYLQTLEARLDAVPDLLRDLNATIVASTAKDTAERALTISLNAKTATGELVFASNGKGGETAGVAGSVQGSWREEDPLSLVAMAGIPLVPIGAPGPAVLEFSGSGDLKAGFKGSVKVDAQGTDGGFDGTIRLGESGLIWDGEVKLESVDFDPYLSAAGLAFSGVGTGTPVQLKSNLKADADTMAFGGFDATVRDNKLSGDLSVKIAERPSFSGTVQADVLDVTWFGENLFGTGMFDALDGNLGTVAFSTRPVVPFDGQIDFTAQRLGLGPLGEASTAKGKLGLTSNIVRLENVTASLFGGTMTGTFDMRNDGGVGAVSGNFSLKDAKAGEMARLRPVTGFIDADGSVTAAGKTLDAVLSGLTGSGVASIREGVVPGFNPQAFAAILDSSSRNQQAPSAADVEALIAASVRTGRFPLNADKLAWSLAGGKLRLPGIKGESSGAVFNADVVGNLPEGSAQVSGSIVYDAGKNSVIGAEPVVPFVATSSQEQTPVVTDGQPMLQFLTQSALEREQARVEALQSTLVEKQRLRRDVRLISFLYADRNRRALLREEAVRAEAARKGAILSAQWNAEEARLEKERIRLEEEKAAREKAAEEKARDNAAKAIDDALDDTIEPATPEPATPETPLPDNKSLDDVFKSLEFGVN
jgi:hypothetical protein